MNVVVGAGVTVGTLVLCFLWGVGSFQLALDSHPSGFGAGWPFALIWGMLSVFAFVIASGGIVVLIAYGVERGRPAIWITLAVAAVLIVLFTWGYVAATDAVMLRYGGSGSPGHPEPTGR